MTTLVEHSQQKIECPQKLDLHKDFLELGPATAKVMRLVSSLTLFLFFTCREDFKNTWEFQNSKMAFLVQSYLDEAKNCWLVAQNANFFYSSTKIAEHFSFYDSLNSWNTLFSKNVPYFFHLSDIQRKSNQ